MKSEPAGHAIHDVLAQMLEVVCREVVTDRAARLEPLGQGLSGADVLPLGSGRIREER